MRCSASAFAANPNTFSHTYIHVFRSVAPVDLQPSTNGTWFRLSGMHTESRPYPLSNGAEILIGTVRLGERRNRQRKKS